MSNPYNAIDAARARLLVELIDEHPDEAFINVYSSGDYVGVEVRAHRVPPEKIREILSLPLEALLTGEPYAKGRKSEERGP